MIGGKMMGRGSCRWAWLATPVITVLAGLGFLVSAPGALAVTAGPAWRIVSAAGPTNFSTAIPPGCLERSPTAAKTSCDSYLVVASNVGGAPTSGPITITDVLPAGVEVARKESQSSEKTGVAATQPLVCEAETGKVTCSMSESLGAGSSLAVRIYVVVGAGASQNADGLVNEARVQGGGAEERKTSSRNSVSSTPAPFGIENFSMEVLGGDGQSYDAAGGHPYEITTNIDLPTQFEPSGFEISGVAQEKNISVTLPPGLLGDPQSIPRCKESGLVAGLFESACPSDSQVGVIALRNTFFEQLSGIRNNRVYSERGFYPVYNMVPEHGYAAEFGFDYDEEPVLMYAYLSPVWRDGQREYAVTVSSPGIIRGLVITDISLTFWGVPGEGSHTPQRQVPLLQEGGAVSGISPEAFLTDPTSCTSGPLTATAAVDTYQEPGRYATATTTVMPEVSGCEGLPFAPGLGFTPELAQADEPSGYGVALTVPQSGQAPGEVASSQVKDVSVTLPAGVSLSPAAADGLVGCQVTGPEGINLGSSEIGVEGQDLSDPEASELGAGHAGGNGSAYDDDLYHAAHGHCPAASTLGTVEVETPLLAPHSLTGHVYLAQPQCGGAGQPSCTEQAAEEGGVGGVFANGGVFGLYMEVEGDGVVVKLPGTAQVGGSGAYSRATGLAPGQIRTTFADLPQVPFSEVQLKLKGGQRAPLANPPTCGQYAAQGAFTPWASPELGGTDPLAAPFTVSWDGAGGACPARMPFAPGFTGGTEDALAGGFSPLTITFSRHDREQDLSGIAVHLPPGLLGKIAGIPLCDEAQANTGSCSQASRIGSATAAVGAGSQPFWQSGNVYLTGGYKGAPYGLSVVVPAQAGPFNLGNIVVRAAISVDPYTAALTVTSDPLPQSIDGVPLRVQSVTVTADRPGFTFNPTSCAQQQITATITAAQGASANTSAPFAAQGCAALGFKPSFTASTAGKASRAGGASLTVKLTPVAGQANIAKVSVSLPKQLPSWLSTLQKACTGGQFAANPAGCPAGSLVGSAIASTPVLAGPLTGPVYLVSHGGAAFPDLEIVLQGEGITVILDGQTKIKNGITSSTFNVLPDTPVSSFQLTLPSGPGHLLATDLPAGAHYSFCGQTLDMPTTLTGQNGLVVTQATKITATGCPRALKLTRAQQLARALKTCRGADHGTGVKRRRVTCESTARRRYAPARDRRKKK